MTRARAATVIIASTLVSQTALAYGAGSATTATTSTSVGLSILLFIGFGGLAVLSFAASKLLATEPRRTPPSAR